MWRSYAQSGLRSRWRSPLLSDTRAVWGLPHCTFVGCVIFAFVVGFAPDPPLATAGSVVMLIRQIEPGAMRESRVPQHSIDADLP